MKMLSLTNKECTQLINGNFANGAHLIKTYKIICYPYANDKPVIEHRIIFNTNREPNTFYEVYIPHEEVTQIMPDFMYQAFEVIETEPGIYTPHDIATYGRLYREVA